MDDKRWRDRDWLAGAHTWIDGRLDELGMSRTGVIEQPHVYPWSTVLRAPTEAGDVWFKANAEPLRHEAAVVERLAARRPDAVPPLLAADTTIGWMLMSDGGESLRTVAPREASLKRWYDILPLYAGIQLDLAPDVDDLLALGVPDMRLAVLPSAYERLMDEIDAERRFRDAAPMVADLCGELAAYGLPELLQHDDLHDGQVFVRDGRHLVLDWGDACVSHPFFTLSVTLEGVLAWGLDDVENSVDVAPFRDAYLAPYAERFAGDLVAASRVAMRLGWACRAVNGHVPGANNSTFTRLRMFLDGRP
ncbi:aminoglycoside phosphotransferase family protein [Micromonospora sp. NPDC050397]|uniref:aminoglycoside phosphotransferase family protein n=1 Tax=Micromonospora sp. NPDC050397 TaxID=3364279 RepID=UPI00384F1E5B